MKPMLTRDAVIRAGACAEGVYELANKHYPGVSAIPLSIAKRLARRNAYIANALEYENPANGGADNYGGFGCKGDYVYDDGGYGGNGDGDGGDNYDGYYGYSNGYGYGDDE